MLEPDDDQLQIAKQTIYLGCMQPQLSQPLGLVSDNLLTNDTSKL
jgi:hypothetical protein